MMIFWIYWVVDWNWSLSCNIILQDFNGLQRTTDDDNKECGKGTYESYPLNGSFFSQVHRQMFTSLCSFSWYKGTYDIPFESCDIISAAVQSSLALHGLIESTAHIMGKSDLIYIKRMKPLLNKVKFKFSLPFIEEP